MRKILHFFLLMLLAVRAGAQSNVPVRLALIAETDEVSGVSDILSAELSKNSKIILLERAEIDKVYREQTLSAANRDYLKLGQVLGADGLMLITKAVNTNRAPPSFGGGARPTLDLSIQLIAVKPGVLLASEEFFGIDAPSQWAIGFAAHLNPLLPKLSVLVKDAVPISIVNVRAAIQSPETQEQERQLTTLTVERLSREPQLFVLERRNLQLLAQEKELKGLDDSAFWNGSFLLEGTMDRNGYSKNRMTIGARLVPPKGGAPVQIEVSGNRTNLLDIVNQLADKVRENLKLSATSVPWNAADEAQKYFEEAKWALRWNLLGQAQSAADSAWALGKRDLDCALVRVNAYQRGIAKVNPVQIRTYSLWDKSTFLDVHAAPTEEELDQALHVLALYDEFSRGLSPDEPKDNSPYYLAGVDSLEKASGVLRHFHFHPESRKPVSGKLAELRAMTRTVADWISKSPSVRNSYAIKHHPPDAERIFRDFTYRSDLDYGKLRNFARCELQWGCFWQERPEDCVALYRSLMTNSLFIYIDQDLWFRDQSSPRFVAWSPEDESRLPSIWQNFVGQLENSSDVFLQVQAKAFQFADARTERNGPDSMSSSITETNQADYDAAYEAMKKLNATRDEKIETTFDGLFTFVIANYEKIIGDRRELPYLNWKFDGLFNQGGEQTKTTAKIDNEYRNKYAPQIAKLQRDHADSDAGRSQQAAATAKREAKENGDRLAFEKQKQFLTSFTPYDFRDPAGIFSYRNYSKEQAAELKLLLNAYCSNILAHSSPETSAKDKHDIQTITFFVGHRLDDVLKASPPPATVVSAPAPPVVTTLTTPKVIEAIAAPFTNVLVAGNFLRYPTEQLPTTNLAGEIVFSHRFREGKLLLDLRYGEQTWVMDTNGVNHQRKTNHEAAAIWSAGGGWQMLPYPHSEEASIMGDEMLAQIGPYRASSPLFFEMFDQSLYVSDRDAIRRYDFKSREWHELPFPGQERAELFAVNHHLYAASSETIWEILDNGQSSKILASVRRQPAASILDSRETLGRPVLFSGKGNTLCVALNREVFSWNGTDWESVVIVGHGDAMGTMPTSPLFRPRDGPEIFGKTAFFRPHPNPINSFEKVEFWRMDPEQAKPVLCWREAQKPSSDLMYSRGPNGPIPANDELAPIWKGPRNLLIGNAPVAIDASNIYFLIDRSGETNTGSKGYQAVEKQGRHADLVCLAAGVSTPLIVPIRYDANKGPVPFSGSSLSQPAWMESSSEFLFIGQQHLFGVWALPKAQIQAELDRLIKNLPPVAPNDPANVSAADRKKALLAKYDLDHDGKIDSQEREAAISDPVFLEFDLDDIDTNHNGMLDAEELAYFDVNKNIRLDPSEAEGIDAAQHILAGLALKQFDWNENGRLDGNEFGEFTRNKASTSAFRAAQFMVNGSEVERLKRYLERATEDKIRQKLMTVPGWSPRAFFGSDPPQTDSTILKQEIDMYWERQHTRGILRSSRTNGLDSSKDSAP